MFRLTRQERLLIAGLGLAFLAGLAVKHYRETGTPGAMPQTEIRDAKH